MKSFKFLQEKDSELKCFTLNVLSNSNPFGRIPHYNIAFEPLFYNDTFEERTGTIQSLIDGRFSIPWLFVMMKLTRRNGGELQITYSDCDLINSRGLIYDSNDLITVWFK